MPPLKRRKGIILFVHGFGSNASCWSPLLKLLRNDEAVCASYEFATWEYPTKWFELNLLGRIPRLSELGQGLADEVDSPEYRGRDLVLVGHSQGGLVIQSFLSRAVQQREAHRLRNIRQAVFFATPTEGSTTGINLRLLFSTLIKNPQEATLRVLNPDVAEMKAIIRNQIVEADDDTESKRRIPIHAFCGMQDNVVPEASARGMFDNLHSVPGTHFSILKPPNTSDPRYKEFAEILLDPGGHKHRFEVDEYRATITVEPRAQETVQTRVRRKPVVQFDNYATVKRVVRFAASNRCRDTFTIRYGTRSDGYVVGHTSHPNRVPPTEQGRWEDTGDFYQFDFVPEPDQEFCLNVEVYQGYGEGQRNVHFHLGRTTHYRRMKFTLDLSAYLRAGHILRHTPHFYLEPTDRGHSDLCKERKALDPLDIYEETPEGVFSWVAEDVEDGVVDMLWDFVPLPALQPATVTPVHVQ